jgi:hypothetical protein
MDNNQNSQKEQERPNIVEGELQELNHQPEQQPNPER